MQTLGALMLEHGLGKEKGEKASSPKSPKTRL